MWELQIRIKPYIVKMCFVLIALGIIGLVCSITAQYFAAKAATGVGTGIRHGLFEHIQKFTFTEMDQLGTSTLITRMTSDINQIQSGVNLCFTDCSCVRRSLYLVQ